jgi:hypothetical protein
LVIGRFMHSTGFCVLCPVSDLMCSMVQTVDVVAQMPAADDAFDAFHAGDALPVRIGQVQPHDNVADEQRIVPLLGRPDERAGSTAPRGCGRTADPRGDHLEPALSNLMVGEIRLAVLRPNHVPPLNIGPRLDRLGLGARPAIPGGAADAVGQPRIDLTTSLTGVRIARARRDQASRRPGVRERGLQRPFRDRVNHGFDTVLF